MTGNKQSFDLFVLNRRLKDLRNGPKTGQTRQNQSINEPVEAEEQWGNTQFTTQRVQVIKSD